MSFVRVLAKEVQGACQENAKCVEKVRFQETKYLIPTDIQEENGTQTFSPLEFQATVLCEKQKYVPVVYVQTKLTVPYNGLTTTRALLNEVLSLESLQKECWFCYIN